MNGIIKVILNGFGFIKPDKIGKDIFFHANSLEGMEFEDLREGNNISFELGEGKNGHPQAINTTFGLEEEEAEEAEEEKEEEEEEEEDNSKYFSIVTDFVQKLVEEIAKYPRSLVNLEWRDLERVLAEVFDGLGFNTELTRSGKDGGFDIKVDIEDESGSSTILIEVKHWMKSGKKPGAPILKAFVEVIAKMENNNTSGLLLSSSGFTNGVLRKRSEIERKIVRLGNSDKIISLCTHYVESKNGIWVEETPLGDVLLSGTF